MQRDYLPDICLARHLTLKMLLRPQFGVGEVIEVDGLAVVVAFENGKTKKLNVEFVRLEKC